MLSPPDEQNLTGVHAPHSLLPCPFARSGLESPQMRLCPGYAAQRVSFTGLGAGESLGDRTTCVHLGTQRGPRGFVTACRHPGGRPVEAEALAARARRARHPRVPAN